jgi:SOS-response transcriptional repressor LexA
MRMLDLLIKTDDRTQAQIAEEAGMKPQVLNDKLNQRGGKNITDEDVEVLAKVLGVSSRRLMSNVSRKQLLDIGIARPKPKQLVQSEPKLLPAAHAARPAPDYTLAQAAGLKIFADVSEALGRSRVPVYPERLAATPDAQLDPTDEEDEIWLDAASAKIYGAQARAVLVSGYSMNQDGIEPGDILICKSTKKAKDGQIVIALHHGAACIKRLRGRQLVSDSDRNFSPLTLGEDDNSIQGVVIGIHKKR